MNLSERFDNMLTRPDTYENLQTEHLIVDTRDHLPFFRSVAKGNVLEIGCDVGNSTTAFLLGVEENGGHVTSVDINPKCAENFPGHPQWTFILGDSKSESLHRQLRGRVFDVLYVDGDHTYEGAYNDIFTFAPLVRSGGLILVHDVAPEVAGSFPGVRQAFDEFSRGQSKDIHNGSWGLGVIQL